MWRGGGKLSFQNVGGGGGRRCIWCTGFHAGFFAGGGEVIVKVVLACVSTATHMSVCEQPRVIWGHVPK